MRFTLWAEGPSDACLIPILTWLLRQCGVHADIDQDESVIFFTKRKRLTDIFRDEDYWSDLLFIQIDADSNTDDAGAGPKPRLNLCGDKVKGVENLPPYVCVIPVQETETWLLVSKATLLHVAGNPRKEISLPGCSHLEAMGNPKRRLCSILNELGVDVPEDGADSEIWKTLSASIPVAERQGYSILRCLPSFKSLETTVKQVVKDHGLAYR